MRRYAAWVIIGLGQLVGTVMNLGEWFGWLYPTYNKLMIFSSDIQGDGPGPWKEPSVCEAGAGEPK